MTELTEVHPIGNAEYINRLNKIKILNIIRDAGMISRAEIVKKAGLSAPTVTRIVDSLINKEKLAQQVGIGESSGGRPPMIVQFNGENNYVIGIDWGRTHIQGVLSDLNAKTLSELDIKTESTDDFDTDLSKVFELIDHLLSVSGIDKSKLMGIGIAAAGFVNKETNLIEFSPNFKWVNVDIRQPLLQRFKVPVKVDNVSRVMALGELLYGLGETSKDFIFLNIGYGIGSGIIMNGQPFYGFEGISGEIGHVKVISEQSEQRKCSCGKFDCLECYSSGRGIAEQAKKEITDFPDSLILEYAKERDGRISTEHVARAAKYGDQLALRIIEQAAEFLGIALSSLSNVLNPECIVLGGKVAQPDSLFVARVREVFNREKLRGVSREIKIVPSKLKGEAAVKGAVSLILQEVLKLNV